MKYHADDMVTLVRKFFEISTREQKVRFFWYLLTDYPFLPARTYLN
jgi:hypothetical protein